MGQNGESPMEIWDLYHRDGHPAGLDHVRGEPLPKGLYHLVCDVILRHADGDFLLMRRAFDKPIYPGFWELTAGGSALKGETPLDCARRELLEETGLAARDFREIAFTIDDDNGCLYHSFVAFTDAPKDAVRLQEGETVDYRWIDIDGLRAFLRSGEAIERTVRRCAAFLRDEIHLETDL